MSSSFPKRKKTTVLEAFETLFKKRDYAGGTHPGCFFQVCVSALFLLLDVFSHFQG
jgi:hypothetical protein